MKVYLLFEWVEERETKNHFGVFSSLEKAQKAAQDDENRQAEPLELKWMSFEGTSWDADCSDPFGEGYTIEEFELDGEETT